MLYISYHHDIKSSFGCMGHSNKTFPRMNHSVVSIRLVKCWKIEAPLKYRVFGCRLNTGIIFVFKIVWFGEKPILLSQYIPIAGVLVVVVVVVVVVDIVVFGNSEVRKLINILLLISRITRMYIRLKDLVQSCTYLTFHNSPPNPRKIYCHNCFYHK